MGKLLKKKLKEYKKIVVWGTGEAAKMLGEYTDIKIDYYIDSNSKKWNSENIFNPNILENEEKCMVIIASMYYKEIIETIEKNEYRVDYIIYDDVLNIEKENEFNYKEDYIISISRNNYIKQNGGTSKFIKEFNKGIKLQAIHVYWRVCKLDGEKYNLVNIVNQKGEEYTITEKKGRKLILNSKSIVIHNLIDMNIDFIKEIIKVYTRKVYYYLHDYSSICKNIKLMKNKDYCDYKGNKEICADCKFKDEKREIEKKHREIFSLKNVQLIAPSPYVLRKYEEVFKNSKLKIRMIPHDNIKIIENKEERIKNNKIKIAYIGYELYEKGWESFKKIFTQYSEKYEFYVLGKTSEDIKGIKIINVNAVEDGSIAMTNAIKENNIDICFIWSIWGETYSYTLYESFEAGRFILTNEKSGNIKEVVSKYKIGKVFRNDNEVIQYLEKINEKTLKVPKKCVHKGINLEIIKEIEG